MCDEGCGLWVEVWTSIPAAELPRLGRAIASICALEMDNLTDSERRHVRNVSASAMLLSQALLEITEAASELYQHDTELYQQMLASAERIREDTRRAAQEIERIVSLKTS